MTFKEILYYIKRIIRWKFGDKSPLLATIKLTYRCNLICLHCPWRRMKNKKELTYDEWQKVLTELYNIGIRILVLEGGEPTLYNDLSRIIIFAKELGLKTILASNGTNPLYNYEPDVFLISIDGTQEIHDSIRGPGIFNKVLMNLENIKTRKVSLTTINKMNYQIIPKILKAIDCHFDAFGFNIVYPYNSAAKEICLNRNEIEQTYHEIIGLSSKYQIVNTNKMLESYDWKCSPWVMLTCEPNGDWEHNQRCFIDLAESIYDCSNCHLACYRALSQLTNGDLNTWYNTNKYIFK